MKYSEKKGINYRKVKGVPLLNFEGHPSVPLLNFRGVPGPTFNLWVGFWVPDHEVSGPGILVSLLYHAIPLLLFLIDKEAIRRQKFAYVPPL